MYLFFDSNKQNILFLMLNNSLNLQWTPGTSDIVERAKLTLDDQRKRELPMHFEQQVFLFTNKRLWNIENVDNVVAKNG